MITIRGCIEDDTTIENGIKGFYPLSHFSIPNFELATEFRLPTLVQVNKHIDPSLEFKHRMVVEVRMNIEVAAIPHLMDATTKEIWVGN